MAHLSVDLSVDAPEWRVRLERYDAAKDQVLRLDPEALRVLDAAASAIIFGTGEGPIRREVGDYSIMFRKQAFRKIVLTRSKDNSE